MLFETRPGKLRLFLPGDRVDPRRLSGRPTKQCPNREEVPSEYAPLLDWYARWAERYAEILNPVNFDDDPLVRLAGSGQHIWADEHADEYVENLRREEI